MRGRAIVRIVFLVSICLIVGVFITNPYTVLKEFLTELQTGGQNFIHRGREKTLHRLEIVGTDEEFLVLGNQFV